MFKEGEKRRKCSSVKNQILALENKPEQHLFPLSPCSFGVKRDKSHVEHIFRVPDGTERSKVIHTDTQTKRRYQTEVKTLKAEDRLFRFTGRCVALTGCCHWK